MFFKKPQKTDELSDCLEQVGMLQHFQATSSSIVPRDIEIPLRSRITTYHREGSRAYQPGDSIRMLILRDLLNRDQMNVKTYFSDSEFSVHIIIDPSPSLLDHSQTGMFALKLAAAIAFASLRRKQTVRISALGVGEGASPMISKVNEIAALLDYLVTVSNLTPQKRTIRSLYIPELIREDIGLARANTNLFFLTHVGHPEHLLHEIFVATQYQMKHSTIYPILSIDEFAGHRTVYSYEAGVVHVPRNNVSRLEGYLERIVELGRDLGVVVHPLVIENHKEDFITAIEALL